MKLALDTNTYRALMEGEARALTLVRRAEVVLLPVPVLAELLFSFLNGTRGRQNEATLKRFLTAERVDVLHCDEETAAGFAALKLQLKRAGTPIPLNDVWIAALALQHGATLFTHDRDFENIPQLLRVP